MSEPGLAARSYAAPQGHAHRLRIRSFSFVLLMMALGFVAFGLAAYVSRMSLDEVVQHSSQRVASMETQVLIDQIDALLVDIETGERAYALTGQDEFLTPYRRAMHRLREAHAQLVSRLSADAGDEHPTAELDALIERHDALLRLTAERRRLAAGEAAPDAESAREGRLLIDAIRGQLRLLKSGQSRGADAQAEAVAEVQERMGRINTALPVLGMLLIGAAAWRQVHERRERDKAEAALRRVNTTLEQQVSQRTTQVQFALRQIQSFAFELDRSIEGERKRIARELHDQFGQIATAIRMVVMGLRKSEPPVPEPVVSELLELVDESISIARRISAALRPPLLDDLGLAAAVKHFAGNIARQSGMQVCCEVVDDDVLSPNQANQLFRILQEATTNVLRHARATELRIEAAVNDGIYQLEVSDNGVGPGSIRPDASGIRNMRERAQLIDGLLQFGPGEQAGTRVCVQVPLTTAMKRFA